jgi:uncharacterized protein YbjQ (UPF0145 family)
MKKQLSRALAILVVTTAYVATPAHAEDKILHIPLKDVIEMPEAKDKLDGTVKFYLAGQTTPKVLSKSNDDVTNKRTNAVGKDEIFACKWAALSALISLQAKAKTLDANGVVEIVSYFKKETYSDPVNFECRKGAIMAAVTLKGNYAKLEQ